MPSFIYGTAWKEERTASLVRAAYDAGFRAFDTANQRKHYHEAGVGEGLRDVPRSELWLQTKYTFQRGQDHRLPYDPQASIGDQVRQSAAKSLVHLGVEHVDSFVLHGPTTSEGLSHRDVEAWRAMEELKRAGITGQIGLSNVSADQVRRFVQLAEIPVSTVQNRCYASRWWDAEVRKVCGAHGIVYQGFSLLTANRDCWNHPEVAACAREHGVTPAAVLFAHAKRLGIVPLTGTSDPRHMRADLDSLQRELPELSCL